MVLKYPYDGVSSFPTSSTPSTSASPFTVVWKGIPLNPHPNEYVWVLVVDNKIFLHLHSILVYYHMYFYFIFFKTKLNYIKICNWNNRTAPTTVVIIYSSILGPCVLSLKIYCPQFMLPIYGLKHSLSTYRAFSLLLIVTPLLPPSKSHVCAMNCCMWFSTFDVVWHDPSWVTQAIWSYELGFKVHNHGFHIRWGGSLSFLTQPTHVGNVPPMWV